MNPLLENPAPDFRELERVLKGQAAPRRVHLVELLIDQEVLQAISECYLGRSWLPAPPGPRWLPSAEPLTEAHCRQLVGLYWRLGYDCVPAWPIWQGHPPIRRRHSADTATLSRGERAWVDEGRGLIASRQELERFPWDVIRADASPAALMARALPPGMKLTVTSNLFEHVMSNLAAMLDEARRWHPQESRAT